jgi:hypothetical protein
MKDNHGNGDRAENRLKPQERKAIQSVLVREAIRRRKAAPQIIRILVDGEERLAIELPSSRKSHVEIPEGAEIIEVWGNHLQTRQNAALIEAPVLLASLRVRYNNHGISADSHTVALLRRRTLVLTISHHSRTHPDASGRAAAIVEYLHRTEKAKGHVLRDRTA